MSPAPIFFSIRNTQRVLDLGHTKIHELMNEGKLKAVKFGRKTLITAESIQQFAASLPSAERRAPARPEKAAA